MARFLLLGVAGAVLNLSRFFFGVPLGPGFREAVRIVPWLLSRLTALREEAKDLLRVVVGVEVEDTSSSMSLSRGSISRLARMAGVRGFMLRRTSANCFIRVRNLVSLSGRAANRAYS
jgi:hypothetical protein